MGSEDQALTVHSKKGRRENHHHQGRILIRKVPLQEGIHPNLDVIHVMKYDTLLEIFL